MQISFIDCDMATNQSDQSEDIITRMPGLVKFKNLLPTYAYGEDIVVAFEYAPGLMVNSDDWIGLFPSKWTRPEQSIAYKSVPPPSRRRRNSRGRSSVYTLVFHTCSIQVPLWNASRGVTFQFAFISHAFNSVLGASNFFRVEIAFDCNPKSMPIFPPSMNIYENPLAFEKDIRPLYPPKFALDKGWRDSCFRPSADYQPLISFDTEFNRFEPKQHRNNRWSVAGCFPFSQGNPEFGIRDQAIKVGIEKSNITIDSLIMNDNRDQNSPSDLFSSRAYQRSSGVGLFENTSKDHDWIHENLVRHFSEPDGQLKNEKLTPQRYGRLLSEPAVNDCQHLASMARELTLNETNLRTRLSIMEKEQLRYMHRIDELTNMMSQKQAENDHMRSIIQRMTEEKMMLIADFKRLELHDSDLCKAYHRQSLHVQDLYFTLNLHGFDYVVLSDGRKVATSHEAQGEILAFEPKRRWSYQETANFSAFCGYKQDRINVLSTETASSNRPAPHHEAPKRSVVKSCEVLVRKLADLEQQRDHIDGYIDWLKAEARKKEHIYDDPFTDDGQHTEDEFDRLPSRHEKAPNQHESFQEPAPSMTSRNDSCLPKTPQIAQSTTPDMNADKRSSLSDSPILTATRTANGQRQSFQSSESPIANAEKDRRESLNAARKNFLRKDSFLSMLLDGGGNSWSKQRKSMFSKPKSSHNAFITGRGYGGDFGGSPKPARKIRTHII